MSSSLKPKRQRVVDHDNSVRMDTKESDMKVHYAEDQKHASSANSANHSTGALKKQLAEIQSKIARTEISIRDAENDMENGRQSKSALRSQISTVETKIVSVEGKIEALETKIVDVEEEVKGIDSDIKMLGTSLSEVDTMRKATLQKKEEDLHTKEADLRAEKADLRTKEADLRSEKADLRAEKAGLRVQEADLGKQETSLLDILASLRKDKVRLDERKVSLERILASQREPIARRIAGIEFGVEEQQLKHRFDYLRFIGRIEDLFQYFSSQTTYMAPYFPLVQSSGMGKTKLLHTFAEKYKVGVSKSRTSRFVLCCSSDVAQENTGSTIYTDFLDVSTLGTKEALRESINARLENMLKQDDAAEVVYMFDEASHLLKDDALAFRCIRQWLQMKRPDQRRIVAVFTGTSSSLSNFYKEVPISQFSRDPKKSYRDTGSELYEPFFDLNTLSIFAPRQDTRVAQVGVLSDFDIAVAYGRPLFSLLHRQHLLDEEKEKAIFERMTLRTDGDWFDQNEACFSLLGTRVQLGQTTFTIATKLVKSAYANLTYFQGRPRSATIGFPPDTVCARLAMCAMDPHFVGYGERNFGREKHEWSKKVRHLVSTSLCTPHKGNIGEVAAALYLLFCGDLLRRQRDPQYRCYAVSLWDWIAVLSDPTKPLPVSDHERSEEINFIQVCRNDLRPEPEEKLSTEDLSSLYQMGCACYCHTYCRTIDLFASIAVRHQGERMFAPLIISVKARRQISSSEIQSQFEKMKSIVEANPHSWGVCLLFLVGLDQPSSIPSGVCDGSGVLLDHFDAVLCPNRIVNVIISVPSDDVFQVSDIVTMSTLEGSALTEVHCSHPFLQPRASYYAEHPLSVLRSSPEKELKSYTQDLSKALSEIQDDNDEDRMSDGV